MFVGEVHKGQDNTNGEDPFRDVERDELSGLDDGRPFVENQELVGGKSIDGIDGDRKEERKPEIGVGKRHKARSSLEVVETLNAVSVSDVVAHASTVLLTIKSHFCSG